MKCIAGAEPRIFITCDIHAERYLCEDVMNVLFSYGIEAQCVWFQGKGFAIVCLGREVNVRRVVGYLVSRHVRGYWVIPVDFVCRTSYEDIARCALNAILFKGYGLPIRIVGVCRKRGNLIDSCTSLLRYVGEYVERSGVALVDFSEYSYIVRIEVVYDATFISIYRRDEEDSFRVARAR